jgi:hypothetical protein
MLRLMYGTFKVDCMHTSQRSFVCILMLDKEF